MASVVLVTQGRIFKGSGATVMARVNGEDATAIQQADFGTIVYSVIDRDGDRTTKTVDADSLTVSDVVFDTLQLDSRWDEDLIGYNFKFEVPETAFPTGGRTFSTEFTFSPTIGEDYLVVAQIDVVDTLT